MRLILLVTSVWMLAACGTTGYHDPAAAVDANPLCASRPDQPGEPVSRDCDRAASGHWSTRRESRPVDFGRGGSDPR